MTITDITQSSGIPETPTQVYPVDIEHTGIRLAGCTTLILTTIVTFFIIDTFILPQGYLLSIFGSLGVAALATYLMDNFLKGRWASGRVLHVNDERITLTRNEKIERVVDPTQHVNVLLWRFVVQKNQRVKKGWNVIACALEQDDTVLPIYAFVAPDDLEKLPLHDEFTLLEAKKAPSKGGSIRDMRHAGEQRRLHDAERERGEDGAEMSLEHFTRFLETLQESFPKWMPQK